MKYCFTFSRDNLKKSLELNAFSPDLFMAIRLRLKDKLAEKEEELKEEQKKFELKYKTFVKTEATYQTYAFYNHCSSPLYGLLRALAPLIT